MSLLFNNLEEDCYNTEALLDRSLITDLVLRKLNSLGEELDELYLPTPLYYELRDALFSLKSTGFDGVTVYSIWGRTIIKEYRDPEIYGSR